MAKKENRTIEEAMEALDQIAKRLESNEITLEESFQIYKEGMELLQYCSSKIDTVEKKVQVLEENGEIHDF